MCFVRQERRTEIEREYECFRANGLRERRINEYIKQIEGTGILFYRKRD